MLFYFIFFVFHAKSRTHLFATLSLSLSHWVFGFGCIFFFGKPYHHQLRPTIFSILPKSRKKIFNSNNTHKLFNSNNLPKKKKPRFLNHKKEKKRKANSNPSTTLRQLQPHFSSNTTNPSHHQTHQSTTTVESHTPLLMNKSSRTQSTDLCTRENK